MKRKSQQHMLVSILHTVGVTLLCAAIGLVIGSVVAFKVTEVRLARYATHLIAHAEAFMNEINTTLDSVNASPYPFCSDEDISRLRTLVFNGHLVKDIGRVRDGYIYCTSMRGRISPPIKKSKPAIVTPSGRSIWLNTPILGTSGMTADITESGEADFVASREAFEHLQEPPMIYTTTLTNRATNQVLRTAGAPLKISDAEILEEKEVLKGNTFYVARCSRQLAPCMVTGITLQDAWSLNSSTIKGFVFIGALAGLAVSFTLLLQPSKRSLSTQLQRALRLNLLSVVYQPIVDVRTGQVLGAEALARWTNEDGQYVRPDVFIAAAEELGFIEKLTRVILRLVVSELGELLRSDPDFHINVNIAAADLADPHFVPMLEKLLRKHKIPARSISLELTERSTANRKLAISSISKLRELGHEFYIDDFGTGYSSLAYLNELAVDAIKIDRVFTDAIGTDSLTAAIVPQILAMAETLHLKVVVEGVERAEQSNYFAALDQKILAQGWHFGEPVPANDLLTLLASKAADKQTV
ncbi:EAL domain-containing protein [Acidicapsa ligni]|uniref:EAL domain-containing protein n=1 Tax=Acidicapsa ligni TaxID=542300 RepID=UPI0021E0D5C4|nr:EAL domain-containing protein [Acidicapsa ligni]